MLQCMLQIPTHFRSNFRLIIPSTVERQGLVNKETIVIAQDKQSKHPSHLDNKEVITSRFWPDVRVWESIGGC